MSKVEDFLVEIGTEELPPKALRKLSLSFTDNIKQLLNDADLEFGEVQGFATPRRLAVRVKSLPLKQADKLVERRGPALAAAYDKEGNPSKAATGFAKSCGVEVSDLKEIKTNKGTWLGFTLEQEGKKTADLIPEIISTSLDKLPIPKRMRWGSYSTEFVRPVHWILMLLGKKEIPATIYGLESGRITHGHRFHHNKTISIKDSSDYETTLEKTGKVIVDMTKREQLVKSQVEKQAKAIGGTAVIDPALLEEVTSMVEWPMAISGNFDERFLDVPSEALISAMKHHQKYFHVVDDQGKLKPVFITVSNIESTDPGQVQKGNEKVIRPRLSDAMFFWDQDKKRTLESHLESLGKVVFQNKLGSLLDKTNRVKTLAGQIAKILNVDSKLVERAAELSKCDLLTEMVGEFPDLQGTMGRYYAEHNNEPKEVALTLEQYYQPRFSGDSIPESAVAQCVSLADKLDTIIGIFGIGLAPTGDKDPFALRRSVLGCIRILIEADLKLDLIELLQASVNSYEQQSAGLLEKNTVDNVYQFLLGRLHVYYTSQGIDKDSVESIVCLKPSKLYDLHKRILAVNEFRKLPQAKSLAAANKRISNILKKATDFKNSPVKAKLLVEPSEKTLADTVKKIEARLKPLFTSGKYQDAMNILAELRDPVDEFFDNVMVMDENMDTRNNRLSLLTDLRGQFLKIADISRLQS